MTDKKQRQRPEYLSSKKFWAGSVVGVLGLLLLVVFLTGDWMSLTMVGFFGMACLAIGGLMVYSAISTGAGGYIAPVLTSKEGKAAAALTNANAMNISRDTVEFKELKEQELQGFPMRCRNDNKFYHVNLEVLSKVEGNGKLKKELVPFLLPDRCDYYDPEEYGNVLTLPNYRKLFQKRLTMWQQVAPWVFVAIIAIEFITLVAIQG